MKKMLAALITVVALIIPLACGCMEKQPEMTERTTFLFDTIITIKLRSDAEAESVISDSFKLCQRYHDLFDRFDPESDIGRINRSGGQPCEVSEETAELIRLGLEYSELSGGRYDITCGRVTGLWDFSAEKPSLPAPSELTAAVKTVDWKTVSIDGNTVTVPAGTELDLGGIAKGYIADRITLYLRERGIDCAIVNLGGNVRVLGNKNGQPFKVGVQSPFIQDGTIGHINAVDTSVVTAGSYQRYFELDDCYYHHIIDLSDGMPADSDLASVSVICESSVQADALATICFLMGAQKGLEFIESISGAEAVFILNNGTIRLSSGAYVLFSFSN